MKNKDSVVVRVSVVAAVVRAAITVITLPIALGQDNTTTAPTPIVVVVPIVYPMHREMPTPTACETRESHHFTADLPPAGIPEPLAAENDG